MEDEKPVKYWRDYYLTHAQTAQYKRAKEKAINTVKEFFEKDLRFYGSCSGGKDSSVLIHLVNSIKPRLQWFSEKDELDYPESHESLKALKEKYNLNSTRS